MEAIVDRQVRQYQVSEYEKGQRASDYTTWLTSSAHYTAKFEEVCNTPSILLSLYCAAGLEFWTVCMQQRLMLHILHLLAFCTYSFCLPLLCWPHQLPATYE